MKLFNKKEICAHLAEMHKPTQPCFESRKLKDSSLSALYHTTPNPIFDRPKSYLNHPNINYDHLERLSDDDYMLLFWMFKEKYLYPKEIVKTAEAFKHYYKLFAESKDKPNWDLVRVLVEDTLEGYKDRQKYYENLLNGGLEALKNNGYVIQLNEDSYRLPKIEIGKNKPTNSINLPLSYCHRRLGQDFADYCDGLNSVKLRELKKNKLVQVINEAIYDVLCSGSLPVYRGKAFRPVIFESYIANNDDVIFWHEISYFLNKKLRKTKMPEIPVMPFFHSGWDELDLNITKEHQLKYKTPSEQCKAAGLSSLAELVRISGVPKNTLLRWHKVNPVKFNIILRGAVAETIDKMKS